MQSLHVSDEKKTWTRGAICAVSKKIYNVRYKAASCIQQKMDAKINKIKNV